MASKSKFIPNAKNRKLTKAEKERYGNSEMLRYLSNEPIYPVGYVQHKIPMSKKFAVSYKSGTRATNIMRQKIYKRRIVHKLIHATTAETAIKEEAQCVKETRWK